MAKTNTKGTINNPYTMSEYESLADAGNWAGGFVQDDSGNVTYIMKEITVTGYSCGSRGSGSGSGDFQFASYTSFSGDPSLDDDDNDDEYGNGGGSGGSSGGSGGSNGNSGGSGNGGSGSGGGNSNSGTSNVENGGESEYHITYSRDEATNLIDAGRWNGGYVEGYGYVMPQIDILSSSNSGLPHGQEILDRAKEFKGTPYHMGGISKTGIDCSGLVSAALDIPRWTTKAGDIPTTERVTIHATDKSFVNELQVGDILVWRYNTGGGHCVIYAGGDSIFHAHGDEGHATEFTQDLIRYWFNKHGVPKVYRR